MKLPIGWESILPCQMRKEAVPPNSKEYQQVEAEFKRTSPTFTIISVCTCVVLLILTLQRVCVHCVQMWQIRNPLLWLKYQVHKRIMNEKLNRDTERWLWHGAAEDAIAFINKEGFNRSYSDLHGTRAVLVVVHMRARPLSRPEPSRVPLNSCSALLGVHSLTPE